MQSAFRSTWTCFLLALMVLALSVGAFAQGGTGELTGQVTDTTGAVISGVTVTLTDTSTGEVRTTVTTPAGTYRFPALPIVGSYVIEIKNKGFKSIKVQNIVISVGVTTTRDVKLEVGAATEQVTVEGGGSQLVQTENSDLSQNVDKNVWANMPLETRSSNEFLGLLPGAEPASNADLGTDRGPAVNGTRSGSGNFMVEGFDNNDQGLGGAGVMAGPGGSNTTISPDAIEEYRVISGTPPAEYGKGGGFVTDTVLKSGTNQWHGALFEYNRIQDLAANSWFSNANGQQDHLVRNQFGGSVGGPIIKDKTFFYFTTEFHRLRTSSPLAANTYTTDFVNFVNNSGPTGFANFMESDPGGICNNAAFQATIGGTAAPCPGAFSTAAPYLSNASTGPFYNSLYAAQPIPLCTTGQSNCSGFTNAGGGVWTGGLYGSFLGIPNPVALTYPVNVYATIHINQPESVNQARYSVKFDHKLSSKDQLNVAYLYDGADTTEAFAGGSGAIGPTLYNHGRTQVAGVTWSHTFSPTILNQARMSYVRNTSNFPGDPSVAGMPNVVTTFDSPTTPAGISFGNSNNLPQFFTENEFVYKDDLSVAHGKHNFKGGGSFSRTRNGSSFDALKNGYLLPNDVEDLVTDSTFTENLEQQLFGGQVFGGMALAEASVNPTTGTLPEYYRGYRANEVAAYMQDDWRVSSRLTVNLGLRWEYFGPPHNFQPGLDANFYQGVPITPIPTTSTNPFFPVNSPYYALFATGSVQQRNHDIWNKDLNNFGPRFGFAYDVFGTQKLVVRGGFGINYDRMYNNIFENIRFNPPFFAFELLGTFGNGATLTPTEVQTLNTYPFAGSSTALFAAGGATPSLRAMDQNLVTPYYEQVHFGFQYQLGRSMVLESNLVGTYGHKLLGIVGRNTFDGQYAAGLDATHMNPNYSSISFRTNCCDSNYAGWQTTLRRRFTNGLEMNLNYTYAKALDDISDAFTTKNASASAYPTDSMNPHFDYGPADFDVRNRFVGSFVYDLPFAKSSRWLGGWQVNGIVSVQDGANFSITNSSVDSNADNQFNDRAVYTGSGKVTNAINHNVSPAHGYLTASDPATGDNPSFGMFNGPHATDVPCVANGGFWCNVGEMQRNSLVGPGFFDADIGFGKTFKIRENMSLKFEGNFFNIFNHPNFLPPNLVQGGANLNSPTTFGMSQATFTNQQTGGPRITQLAVRFDF